MDFREIIASRLLSLAALVLAVTLLVSIPTSYAQDSHKVLKGKVEDHNRVTRLPRPAMPAVAATGDGTNLKGKIDVILSDINPDDVSFAGSQKEAMFKGGSSSRTTDPKLAGSQKDSSFKGQSLSPLTDKGVKLKGGDTSEEMVIAWERWHHRVCEAMFQNWVRNNTLLGRAETVITVTSDGHITVDIVQSHLSPEQLAKLPPDNLSFRAKIERAFENQVNDSIYALEGQDILAFPPGSQRTSVVLEKNFIGGHDEGYEWSRDDYERVRTR